MSKFCTHCGAPLKEGAKFCSHCGAGVQDVKNGENSSARTQNQVPPLQGTKPVSSGGSNGSMALKIGAAFVVAVAIGFGTIQFMDSRNKPAETPAPAVQTEQAAETPKEAPETEPAKPVPQGPMEISRQIAREYGVKGTVEATTYGHNDNGFLIVEGGKGRRITLIDTKNHRVAYVGFRHQDELRDFYSMFQSGVNEPNGMITVDFTIDHDTHDKDEKNGDWIGDTHRISVFCDYKYQDGVVEPGMLYSGVGFRPGHYHGYLYEQKNVDMCNLLLEDLPALFVDADKHKVSFY
ncbi:MAG: zinc-ribbon domain-containing protein [Acidaminococcus sp.]|jgi:hypothetical protein|nr:zinc-ribbon domain-containing protein [Acidaminococcus sp.]MCI2099743.1 zinc-ribbon domain-containing protein [Acidaminococcus sp.]MCI2113987.1 zinc-ribbon domain-containing protein [Acidaminococcus sp.]MCI2116096.1 zinc-ribbon domain-containing protein [Acidaminococcus sp.]